VPFASECFYLSGLFGVAEGDRGTPSMK
jgi:hypothetical protein